MIIKKINIKKKKAYLSCSNNNRNMKKSKLKLIKENINRESHYYVLILFNSVFK